jgi:uncharacterized protein (DUF1684 family)
METKRSWLLYWLLFSSVPCFAAEYAGYQGWLQLKEEFAGYAEGPTGYYSIQDMRELNPGGTAYLVSSKNVDRIRWSDKSVKNVLARVEYKDHTAMISGPGIQDTDLLQLTDRRIQLPNQLIVRVSFLHETSLKVWLYNPTLPAERRFKSLTFFDYDPRGVVQGIFHRYETPAAVSYLDSRDDEGTMYVMGTLEVEVGGKSYDLKTYSYQKSWDDIEALLILLRDRTSGKTSYAGGRVAEVHFPKGAPPERMTIDLNRTYSFLCAHSNFYNCPLVLTTRIDAELNYGEKYPPLFSSTKP